MTHNQPLYNLCIYPPAHDPSWPAGLWTYDKTEAQTKLAKYKAMTPVPQYRLWEGRHNGPRRIWTCIETNMNPIGDSK